MKKNLFTKIITVVMLVAVIFSFASCQTTEPTPEPTTPVAKDDTKFLTDAATKRYTANDQYLQMKNDQILMYSAYEIEAMHGKIFDDEAVSAYFNNKSWYTPDENYDASSLNEIEKYNVWIFTVAAQLKSVNFALVTSPMVFDITSSGTDETITFAKESESSIKITVEGVRYTPNEMGAEPVYDTAEQVVEVPGTLTGNVYLANLINSRQERTLVIESKVGDKYYNTVVAYYVKPGSTKKPENAKQMFVVSSFVGNVKDPKQVSFYNEERDVPRRDDFVANYVSTKFVDFEHSAVLTVTDHAVTILKPDMFEWNKEVKIIADLDIHVSKLDKGVVATMKAGETWKIVACDEDSWMKFQSVEDPTIEGYVEFNAKLKAITAYTLNNGSEKKTTGDYLDSYIEGILIKD